jgi:hypothetical protein
MQPEAASRSRLREAVLPFYVLHQTVILSVGYLLVPSPLGDPLNVRIAPFALAIAMALPDANTKAGGPFHPLSSFRPSGISNHHFQTNFRACAAHLHIIDISAYWPTPFPCEFQPLELVRRLTVPCPTPDLRQFLLTTAQESLISVVNFDYTVVSHLFLWKPRPLAQSRDRVEEAT